MSLRMSRFWMPLFLGVLCCLAVPLPVLGVANVQVKAVDPGQGKLKEVQATAYLAAPPAKIWKALTDYHSYKTFMPRVASSQLNSRNGNQVIATMKLELPIPFRGTWYTNQFDENPAAMSLSWRMLKGSLKHNEGSWRLKPQAAGTFVTYTVRTDPGVPLIPKWVIETVTKQTIPSIFEALEKRANSL